jgi:hypothetical protein
MAMRRFHHACAGLALLFGLGAAPLALACGPTLLERAVVDRVTQDGDIILQDQRRVRLAGLHLLEFRAAMWPRSGEIVAVGLLGEGTDRWSRHAGLVFILPHQGEPIWLQHHLLQNADAIARPEAALGDCWARLARVDRLTARKPVHLAPEAGRYTSISGRVQRIGEGRSAHFISIIEPTGNRVAGMIQKRHLKRFRDAGVDVATLQGHVIQMRGVRSAANPAVIPLLLAEQIEIVR